LKRKFITNLGFLLLLNLIIKPVYVFGIDRVVQNSVGAEVYGQYFTLFNIAIIFQIFLDLGIESFIRKEIARHPEKASGFFSNIVILKLLLLVPYLIVCLSVAFLKGISKDNYLLLFLILFNQFLASFILFLRANLGGFQFFKTESIISVLDRTLMILVVGFLLLYPITRFMFRITWFVMAQTLAYGITLIIGLTFLFKKTGRISGEVKLKHLLPIIGQLKPLALLVLLMALYYRADSIFLSLLLADGDEQAGIFAHGFRILDFMSNYALLFPILLLPIFSRTIHLKQRIDGLLELSALLLIVPSLSVIAPAILYRQELFGILYKEYIELSANSFAILTVSFLGMCISYTFGALLTANGNLKQLNIMAGTAVILNISLNLILVPRYKVIGASMANALSQVFTIIVHIVLTTRIFHLKFNYKIPIKLIAYIAFLILAALVVKKTDVHWLLGSAILFTTSFAMALTIGLISPKGILLILRQEEIDR
jgi:O-antigen/teichoic acid export membrane protein